MWSQKHNKRPGNKKLLFIGKNQRNKTDQKDQIWESKSWGHTLQREKIDKNLQKIKLFLDNSGKNTDLNILW